MNIYQEIKNLHLEEMKNMNHSEIYDYLYNSFKKQTVERRCNQRQVYYSYAKGNTRSSGLIRKMYLKTQGLTVKSEHDQDKFQQRYEYWLNLDVGELYSVEEIREEGSFGQEWRIIMNFAVCSGTAKIFTRQTRNKREINLYRRINGTFCPYVTNLKDLLSIKKCTKCKTIYPLYKEHCDVCSYKKGENKSKSVKLIEIKSKKEWCNLDNSKFVKSVKGVVNGNNTR